MLNSKKVLFAAYVSCQESAVVNIYRNHQTEHEHFFMESFFFSMKSSKDTSRCYPIFGTSLHSTSLTIGVCSTSWVSSSSLSSSSHRRGIFFLRRQLTLLEQQKRQARKKLRLYSDTLCYTCPKGLYLHKKYWRELSDGSAGLLGKTGLKEKKDERILRFPLSPEVCVTLILFPYMSLPIKQGGPGTLENKIIGLLCNARKNFSFLVEKSLIRWCNSNMRPNKVEWNREIVRCIILFLN